MLSETERGQRGTGCETVNRVTGSQVLRQRSASDPSEEADPLTEESAAGLHHFLPLRVGALRRSPRQGSQVKGQRATTRTCAELMMI